MVEEVPVTVACRACGERTAPELPMIHCQACQSQDTEIVAGRDFFIKAIEVM